MKISKRSWHYELLHNHNNPPKNLCTYFWVTVIKSAFLIALTGALIFAAGCVVYIFFIHTILGWMLLPAGGLIWLGARRWGKRIPRPPGLIRSYIRAKKERVCPLIEYTA